MSRDTLISATCFHHGLEVTWVFRPTEKCFHGGFLGPMDFQKPCFFTISKIGDRHLKKADPPKNRHCNMYIYIYHIYIYKWEWRGATSLCWIKVPQPPLIHGSLSTANSPRILEHLQQNQIEITWNHRYHHSTPHFWINKKSRSHPTKVMSTWKESSLSHCQMSY